MTQEGRDRLALARFETGVPGLDTVLQGGLFAGGVYIVQGAAGTGKTILANHICFHQARRNQRIVYATLLAESHDRLLQYLSSLDFIDLSLIPDRLSYVSAYATLTEEGLPGVVKAIRKMMRHENPDLLVLDGLFVAQERVDSATAFREFIYELQGIAAISGCTMLFLTNGPSHGFSPEHTMVDGFIQLHRELVGARAVRSLVVEKLRGGPVLEGQHFVKIDRRGLVVFPRLETLVGTSPVGMIPRARLSTGVPDLDRMTSGGLPVKSTTLVAGPSGIGKTTLGLAFLSQCTTESRGVFFGCYEASEELMVKAGAIGIDTRRLQDEGSLAVVWHRPLESSLDELAHILLDTVDRTGATRVFIDGIGAFQQTVVFPDRLTPFFTALSLQLRGRGVTALCSVEAPKFFQPEELALHEISPIAENMLLLRFAQTGSRLTRTLTIIKMRQSGYDPEIVPFEITDHGIVIAARGHAEDIPTGTRPSGRTPGSS